ncbi:DinB-like domain protein [Gemmatirosa kalamazoonensis]|uniref:DinB-like domain protein n=1 Tax=Gemmatirosa kalamazoonensis TaxID=861299 RepID=W0REA9_9BACT|nr:DinB family protein [Gemmatirosa kalamazoonensis]AHG89151.1 DinB-like domain protein [Gemmatirosa kalamazoonensis]
MTRIVAAVVLALPSLAAAQASPGVTAAREAWRQMTTYITRAAEQMPEADYAYRPIATVRTFGQMIGHVAGAQRVFCAAALGDPEPREDAIEKSATTKAALVQALKASTTYCERAYALTDAQAAGRASSMGDAGTKLTFLAENATHNAEHYGNIVTYMRMKGMVPPSSQPRSQ